MAEKKIADLFHIETRFLRSVHLERDFQDPSALSNYIVTDFVRVCTERIAHGLQPRSGQRAWRLTGNYGSGKSSFALLLAHWFAGQESQFPPHIRSVVNSQQLGVACPQYLPVLVTCSRQALGTSILKSLHWAVSQLYGRGAKAKLLLEVQRLLEAEPAPTDEQVFQLILKVNTGLIAESKSKGLLLILDELGKFLEVAALYPQRHDVFLLQQLAEAAARSGDEPLFVAGLLHQGFTAFANYKAADHSLRPNCVFPRSSRTARGLWASGGGLLDVTPTFPIEPKIGKKKSSAANLRGRSSQVLPSRRRPVRFFFTPPHCLKKNATPALAHWFLISTTHRSFIGLAPGPDSPPTMTQSIPRRLSEERGPSKGSNERNLM